MNVRICVAARRPAEEGVVAEEDQADRRPPVPAAILRRRPARAVPCTRRATLPIVALVVSVTRTVIAITEDE